MVVKYPVDYSTGFFISIERGKIMNEKTCKNPNCKVSSGIDEILTFGSGVLDDLGFWSQPCSICAREAEKKDGVIEGSYWPHTKEWLKSQGFK
jgi:hypothetical protein